MTWTPVSLTQQRISLNSQRKYSALDHSFINNRSKHSHRYNKTNQRATSESIHRLKNHKIENLTTKNCILTNSQILIVHKILIKNLKRINSTRLTKKIYPLQFRNYRKVSRKTIGLALKNSTKLAMARRT